MNLDQAAENTDAIILKCASKDFTKIAMIISKTFDALESQAEAKEGETPAKPSSQDIASRIYTLVESGKLESTGNIRRWRDSSARLPKA